MRIFASWAGTNSLQSRSQVPETEETFKVLFLKKPKYTVHQYFKPGIFLGFQPNVIVFFKIDKEDNYLVMSKYIFF